jgi:ubiquitin-protein ligase
MGDEVLVEEGEELLAASLGSSLGQEEEEEEEEEEGKSEELRLYKLTLEYKALRHQAPGGVFVVPSFSDLRIWHGVIFVRRGHYANGVFKFTVYIPPDYSDWNTWPKVIFSSKVFNPFVNPATGELKVQSFLAQWDPKKHYMVTVLTLLKKIFYVKDFDAATSNEEAKRLFAEDKDEFLRRVGDCVRNSIECVYEGSEACSLKFTEPRAQHDELRNRLLGEGGDALLPSDVDQASAAKARKNLIHVICESSSEAEGQSAS